MSRRLKRKAASSLTPTEVKLLRTLETPIDVKFKASKLQDVVDYLSTLKNLPINPGTQEPEPQEEARLWIGPPLRRWFWF